MLVLTLPPPVSANRYWATRVITPKGGSRPMALTYVTPEAKQYRKEVVWIARAAGARQPLQGRIAVDLKLYPHRPQDWKTRQRKLGDMAPLPTSQGRATVDTSDESSLFDRAVREADQRLTQRKY